jgi:hypothetical protein
MSQTELVTIPAQTALQVFTTDGAMDPFLARVRQEIDGFTPDITTAKGRKAVAAMAYKVSQTKSYLEGVGKALAAEAKLVPGKIDASRARMRGTLDQWRDEVRKPLTDWELAEETRVFRHRSAIAELYGQPKSVETADQIAAAIASTEAFVIGPDLEEFTTEYAMAKDTALRELRAKLLERKRLDAEEAERARIQREAEERAAEEREERIRAEAVAAERARAEREAAVERERVEQEAAAERRRVEAEAARVEAAAKAERDAAERRERDLRLQAEEANRRAAETELRLKREAEDKARQEAEEAARREADTRRRGRVNREAVAALVAGGVPEELAKLAVTMIARKAVPHVAITY